jgi:hypothetical protein
MEKSADEFEEYAVGLFGLAEMADRTLARLTLARPIEVI